MKQRIRVAGIVRNRDGILILKRARNRSESPVFWELPTGKIGFGEQPEEAMVRALSEHTNLTATTVALRDVITFLAPEGASQVSNLYIIYEITAITEVKPVLSSRYTNYKYTRDFATVHLNEASAAVVEIEDGRVLPKHVSPRNAANSVTIHVDGASRGNPGPSGIGYVIIDQDGHTMERGGEFIGFASSRVAEYYALKKGVERAIEMRLKTVKFSSDSLMVINQMNGVFHPKNQDIMGIYKDIQRLLDNFDSVSFSHVPREKNMAADIEANAAIDQILER